MFANIKEKVLKNIQQKKTVIKQWYIGKKIERIKTGLDYIDSDDGGIVVIDFIPNKRHWTSKFVHNIVDTSYRAKRFVSKNWEFCIQTCLGIIAIAVAIVLSWK